VHKEKHSVQIVKKHTNSHQQYINRMISEGTVTEEEVDTTHSRIQKLLQVRPQCTGTNPFSPGCWQRYECHNMEPTSRLVPRSAVTAPASTRTCKVEIICTRACMRHTFALKKAPALAVMPNTPAVGDVRVWCVGGV
jgi:hypothetical protein